ncbi:hypothetical protein FOA52_003284 [Chlamydomonas sp. UWO 241]|nr:hypothetical protein FOA52_003284 [Chlamydomonas sp. UWO 241]
MEEQLGKLRELATELAAGGDAAKVKALASRGSLSLLRLRSENKSLAHGTEDLKEETAKAKAALEADDLALQNLLYEKQYYEKEVRSCRSFQSAYSDESIGLQSEAEFWETAEADMVEMAKGGPHALMLQRLAHEMRLRKSMAKDLEGIKVSKSALLQTVGQQERVLKQLQGNLKSLDDAARPLHSVLSGGPVVRSISRASSELLPVALFVLYSQMAAARDALGLPITVSVAGAVEEAIAFADQMAAEAAAAPAAAGAPSTSGAGGAVAADEKQRAAKRARVERDDMYRQHPLSVEVQVKGAAPGQPPLTVRFQYLLALRLVVAGCDSPTDNELLAALFPYDDGSVLPSEAAAQLEAGSFVYDSSLPAKPYKWCQHLAGIDLVPSLPLLPSQMGPGDQPALSDGLTVYRKQQRVVAVVGRLTAVRAAHAALNALLAKVAKGGGALLPTDTSRYTRRPVSLVTAFELVKAKRGGGADAATPAASTRAAASTTRTPLPPPPPPPSSGRRGVEDREEGEAGELPEEGEAGPDDEEGVLKGGGGGGGGGKARHGGGGGDGGLDEGEISDDGEYGDNDDALMAMMDGGDEDGTDGDGRPGGGGAGAAPLFELGGGGGAVAAARCLVKPPFRLYRCAMRSPLGVEVEAHVRLFLEYPTRPPLLLVMGVAKAAPAGAAKGKARALAAVNARVAIEREANVCAVSATPASVLHETLMYQLLHARLALDEYAAELAAEQVDSSEADVAGALAARQRLRGRDRRPPTSVYAAALGGSS